MKSLYVTFPCVNNEILSQCASFGQDFSVTHLCALGVLTPTKRASLDKVPLGWLFNHLRSFIFISLFA